MKLNNKVAFITGFGSGLGQAIAVMFAKEGAAVCRYIDDRDQRTGDIGDGGERRWQGFVRAGDVAPAQMKGLIEETVARFGGLDVGQSAGREPTALPISLKRIGTDLDANLKGAFVVSRLGDSE
jgi:NAD(P)-dependent dehydrogenase (short-subunit alcohol dehydrogenase family)